MSLLLDNNPSIQRDKKVIIGDDFEIVIQKTVDITLYAFDGKIFDPDTGTEIFEFTPVPDIPTKTVVFPMTDVESGGLTATETARYELHQTNDVGFRKMIMWGNIPIYDSGTN